VAVLAQQQHALVVVQHDDRDGSGVPDDLPAHDSGRLLTGRRRRPVAVEHDPLGDDVEHHALVDDLGPDDRTGLDPVRHGHQAASSSASCRARAAPIRPAKSGCADVGRDLNSGCACVET
jgi:hypothetical protein